MKEKQIIMNIDRIEFLAWINVHYGTLRPMSNHIIDLQKKRASIDGEELLDNQDLPSDAQKLVTVPSTLPLYSGRLSYYTIKGLYTTRCLTCISFIRDSFNTPQSKI